MIRSQCRGPPANGQPKQPTGTGPVANLNDPSALIRRLNDVIESGQMNMKEYALRQIGTIHTPHKDPSKTPIQPVFASGVQGSVELFGEYVDGLTDLEGFSHIHLLYFFDRSTEEKLKVKPYLEDKTHGIFATRAPHRPNKIGLSVVRLLGIERNILSIEDVDMLDGTPLLDIKPYIGRFDVRSPVRSGWQDNISDDLADLRGRMR